MILSSLSTLDYFPKNDMNQRLNWEMNVLKRKENIIQIFYFICENGWRNSYLFLMHHYRLDVDLVVNGFPVLYVAAQNGHEEIVELLATSGANLEVRVDDSSTPLYIATQEGHLGIVEILLENGSNVDCLINGGFTPLYIAAQKGETEILECLLDHGADINAVSEEGSTALCIACQFGYEDVVSVLLLRGANPNFLFKGTMSPLYIASSKGYHEIVMSLLEYHSNPELCEYPPLYKSCQKGHLDVYFTTFT